MPKNILCFSCGLLLSLVAAHPALAQQNFHPGYIVRLAGDTLGGEVDARGEQRMAKQCLFRTQAGAEPIRYAPTALKAYGVRGANYYEAGTLPATGGTTAGATVFLRVMARGKAMLYAYPDADDRAHYYVRKGAEPLTELVQTAQTVQTSGALRQEQTYPFRQVLSHTFSDCPAVQSMLVRAELKESQLVSIFNRYNTCGPGQQVAEAAVRKTRVHFGMVAGGQTATSNFIDEGELTLRSSLRPVFGLGLLVNPNALNRKLGIRLEVLYQKQLHEGQYERITGQVVSFRSRRNAQIALPTVRVPLMLRYTFPKGRLRPYVQGGVETAILLDTKQAFVTEDNDVLGGGRATTMRAIDMRPLGFGPTGGLGMLVPTGNAGSFQLEGRVNKLDNGSQAAGVLGGATTISFLLGYNWGH